MEFVWILAIGIPCIAITIALVTGWERRRARLLKQAGTILGLRAFEKGDPLAIPSVEIMRKRGRTVGAALEGTWQGQRMMVFDLSYPAGKDVSRQTIFMLRLDRPCIPEFAAIRKNIWLYTPTVDLPDVQAPPPTLKSHWFLYAPGGEWPFDAMMRQSLERNAPWSVEGCGSGLFVYQRGKRVSTKGLKTWLDEAATEAKRFAEILQ